MKFAITTWNVNSLKVRLPQVLEFLSTVSPEVLCLQELKMQDADIDHAPFEELGYAIETFGQKTYNGVATIAKKSVCQVRSDLVRNIPSFKDSQSRLLAATIKTAEGNIRVVNGYFPNGEATDSEKYPYKLKWLKALTLWLGEEIKKHPQLVLLGDFNIAPEDQDVYDPAGWARSVLCVPEVREAFQRLLDIGLVDSFRAHKQPPKTYSWWDYRMLAFRRNHGLRIDHILISKPLAARNQSVVINKDFRAKERPSDHAPVTLTLEF